jgi:hypothetical protein
MSNRKVQIPPRWRDYGSNNNGPTFSGDLADAVFSKKLLKTTLPHGWAADDVKPKYDPYNEYTLNSYNCRGPEFSSGVDFIFAGCSQTFGIGVPDDGVWPKFVADALNGTYVNLSMLGAGMEWITDSIYRYVHTFGKPNRGIMVLAPDYHRVDVLVDNEINKCSRHGITDYLPQYYDESNLDFRMVTCHLENSDPVAFIKRPFPVDNTMIEAEAIRRSIKAIKDLEVFCDQAEIPLIWSTWYEGLDELANTIPDAYKFSSYIPTNIEDWRSNIDGETDEERVADYIADEFGNPTYCHFDLADHYGLGFHRGTDRFKFEDGQQSHMGVHRHIHVASAFTQQAIKLGI